MLAVVDAHVVNGDDIWMLEKSGSRNLAPEPLDVLFGRKLPGQNHFQRDDALKAGLARAINHAHSATGNLFE